LSALQELITRVESNQRRTPLRRLYREVAKRVHPDLTLDDEDRSRRQRLMAEANQAFEAGDLARLTKLFELTGLKPEQSHAAGHGSDIIRETRKVTLNARLHITFLERYGSEAMIPARRKLAEDLLTAARPDLLPDDVAELFDEMDTFLGDAYLDEELLWSAFGYCAVRWWAVSKNYILERRSIKADQTLYAGFEDLAARFAKRDTEVGLREPARAELISFLHQERKPSKLEAV
jgi:hypothetical protein